MKEWIKNHQDQITDVIIGVSVSVCTGAIAALGGWIGMKYSENVFNDALKGAYKAGALKAFDGNGNLLPSGNEYLFSWKYYNK